MEKKNKKKTAGSFTMADALSYILVHIKTIFVLN